MTVKPGLYLVLLPTCCRSSLIQGQRLTFLSIVGLAWNLHLNKPKAEGAATDDCLTSYPYTYVQVQQMLIELLPCEALYLLKCVVLRRRQKP